jgi:hypothetical protein
MSPAMSAISFVMDGVAHAANDGFVSGAAYCIAASSGSFVPTPAIRGGCTQAGPKKESSHSRGNVFSRFWEESQGVQARPSQRSSAPSPSEIACSIHSRYQRRHHPERAYGSEYLHLERCLGADAWGHAPEGHAKFVADDRAPGLRSAPQPESCPTIRREFRIGRVAAAVHVQQRKSRIPPPEGEP